MYTPRETSRIPQGACQNIVRTAGHALLLLLVRSTTRTTSCIIDEDSIRHLLNKTLTQSAGRSFQVRSGARHLAYRPIYEMVT